MSNNQILDQVVRRYVGYYSADELIKCACSLIRKFGITGSSDILKKIQSVLKLSTEAYNFLNQIKSFLTQAQFYSDYLFGMKWVEALLYSEVSKLDICPLFNTALFNMIRDLDVGNNLMLGQFFKDQADVLAKYGNIAQKDLSKIVQLLTAISQIALLMHDCAANLTGGGLKTSGTVGRSAGGPLIDYSRYPGSFTPPSEVTTQNTLYVDRGYLCKASNGVIYTAVENNGNITLYTVNGNTITSVNNITGYYPKVYFDVMYIRCYTSDNMHHISGIDFDLTNQVANGESTNIVNTKDMSNAMSQTMRFFFMYYDFVSTVWSLSTVDPTIVSLVNLGQGIYGGIFSVGSNSSNWYVFASINNDIYLVKLTGDCSTIQSNTIISQGTYPKVFLSEDLGTYALVKNNNGITEISFSSDLNIWTASTPVSNFSVVTTMYHLCGDTITLQEWLSTQKILEQNNLGYPDGYLSQPFNTF